MNAAIYIKNGFVLLAIYFFANLVYLYFKNEQIVVSEVVKFISFALIAIYMSSKNSLKNDKSQRQTEVE